MEADCPIVVGEGPNLFRRPRPGLHQNVIIVAASRRAKDDPSCLTIYPADELGEEMAERLAQERMELFRECGWHATLKRGTECFCDGIPAFIERINNE